MKIAMIGLKGLPSKGGGERVAEAIVRRLSDRHEFTVYCDRNYTPADAHIPRVTLLRFPTLPGKHLRMFMLDLLAALHAVVLGRYDLIHVHNAETGFVNLLLRIRYRVVGTSHTLAYTADKWGKVARWLMKLADYPFLYLSNVVTCISPVLKPYYEHHRPVVVIPNGVEPDPQVDVVAARRVLYAYGIVPKRYILFAAGRIIPFKGCHLLIEAYHKITTDLRLVIVGDLEQMPEYGHRLRTMADDRVDFIPFIGSQPGVLGLVAQSALFVFPSTNALGMEGMSMMLLEVASLGVPLLASDIPQNVAVLGENGYYFHSDSVADLVAKLQGAVDHLEEMKTRAESSREYVRNNFAWNHLVERYDSIYRAVNKRLPIGDIIDQ